MTILLIIWYLLTARAVHIITEAENGKPLDPWEALAIYALWWILLPLMAVVTMWMVARDNQR